MTDIISSLSSAIQGRIEVQGDKSISHRAVMLGAIAQGTTTIDGFLASEDCLATVNAFRAMGVLIEGPFENRLVIHGVGKNGLEKPESFIDCGNSGTTMRLLSGLLSAQNFNSKLTGDASLRRRPMERVARPLRQMGAEIITHEGHPPLVIHNVPNLQGIAYQMPEASAQVKSCILLAGMYAVGETTVIEDGFTRDHTERMLTAFSYPIRKTENAITINALSECQGIDLKVPGDISSAAFFLVAATLIPQSDLWILNVGINPTRVGVIEILNRMGASIRISNKRLYGEEPVADLHIRSAALEGIEILPSLVPSAIDEFPIIFIAAACAKGETVLRGAKELRYKESDRIAAMVNGLQALGIKASALDDGVHIFGGQLQGGMVDSKHDHRIAMAFAIAGALTKEPVTIHHCDSIATSFPAFVPLAQTLGMSIREVNHGS